MNPREIALRSWVKASEAEIRTGLLGYVSVVYRDLVLDGLVLRKTADGRYAISFPARTDRNGKRHPFIRPIDNEAREAIERELLWQIGEHPEFQP